MNFPYLFKGKKGKKIKKQQKKFYAVRVGRRPGIYHSWPECQAQVDGFQGAKYKSFASYFEAQGFMGHTVNLESAMGPRKPGERVVTEITEEIDSTGVLVTTTRTTTVKRKAPIDPTQTVVLPGSDSAVPSSFNSAEESDNEEDEEDYYEYPEPKRAKFDPATIAANFIQVYADGACEYNGKPHAVAAVGVFFPFGLDCEEHQKPELSFSEKLPGEPQTNNRAEIWAAIRALEIAPVTVPLCVLTDSEYLIKSVTLWSVGWRKRDWVTKVGEPVKNRDLFEYILFLLEVHRNHQLVHWIHVPGHQGIPGNERADALARNGLAAPKIEKIPFVLRPEPIPAVVSVQ